MTGTVAVEQPLPTRPAGRFSPWKSATVMVSTGGLGALSGLLFRWEQPAHALTEVTAWDILLHNGGLAVIMVALTTYVAFPVVLFNCFFLGMVLHASVATEGWAATLALTGVHVPLEMLAWLLTLWMAHRYTALALRWFTDRVRPGRQDLKALAPLALTTLVVYVIAATAEWFELWLVI